MPVVGRLGITSIKLLVSPARGEGVDGESGSATAADDLSLPPPAEAAAAEFLLILVVSFRGGWGPRWDFLVAGENIIAALQIELKP